ncbi:hypothetical protein GGU11DRAFT_89004 [Lentinula aff. detonsa]|nr:hypothetical protein GGU11DRAFT_89004 [Lentinula aff. detonsa]
MIECHMNVAFTIQRTCRLHFIFLLLYSLLCYGGRTVACEIASGNSSSFFRFLVQGENGAASVQTSFSEFRNFATLMHTSSCIWFHQLTEILQEYYSPNGRRVAVLPVASPCTCCICVLRQC